jgi:hypothetical protein
MNESTPGMALEVFQELLYLSGFIYQSEKGQPLHLQGLFLFRGSSGWLLR